MIGRERVHRCVSRRVAVRDTRRSRVGRIDPAFDSDGLVTRKQMSLLQVSKRTQSRLFSFMNPLPVEIWLSLLGAYVMVSLAIWIVARLSPYEWVEPSPCPSCKCPLQVGSRCAVRNDRSIRAYIYVYTSPTEYYDFV